MKKARKIILITIMLLVLLSGCNIKTSEKNKVSVDKIKEHLTKLTSKEFEGRMIGTKGNDKAVEYINGYFKQIELVPVEGNSFTQKYNGLNISYTDSPKFKVVDKSGVIIKSFSEGIDYKVRLDNSSMPGDFIGAMKNITDKQSILKNEFKYEDLAIILDYKDKQIQETYLSESQIDDRIYYKGAKVLIYPELDSVEKRDLDLGTKNSWGINKGLIKLGMSQTSFQEILDFSRLGYKLEIHIPIEFNQLESTNIIGMIPGKVKDYNNIIIATSFDGYGYDGENKLYEGAADNASSTALLLELSKVLKEENKRWDSNIIFLALNGNKLGDRGFDNFLRLNNISKVRSQIIYLDKIGTFDGELNIGTYDNPNVEYKNNQIFFKQLVNTIDSMNIKFNQRDNYLDSDYINFRYDGIISSVITFGDNKNIGTPKDTLDNVNLANITEVGEIILNYINDYADINILSQLFQLFRSIWWLLLIAILLLFLKFYKKIDIFIRNKMGNLRNIEEASQGSDIRNSYLNNKPLVAIYLVVMLYVIILIIQAKHEIYLYDGILLKDINVTASSILYSFLSNILSSGLMIAFLSFFMFPVVLILILFRFFKDRIKLSKGLNYVVIGILAYFAIVIGFGIFYNYEYALVMPTLFTLPKAHFLGILSIGLYSYFVTFIISKELKNMNNTKLILSFLVLFIIFASAIYSPYLFNKTIIGYKAMNGRIRF